jgi:hypothetical protein
MRKHLVSLVFGLVGGLFAFGVGWLSNDDADSARCPTEDSCTVDYSDGAWHVSEDRP